LQRSISVPKLVAQKWANWKTTTFRD